MSGMPRSCASAETDPRRLAVRDAVALAVFVCPRSRPAVVARDRGSTPLGDRGSWPLPLSDQPLVDRLGVAALTPQRGRTYAAYDF